MLASGEVEIGEVGERRPRVGLRLVAQAVLLLPLMGTAVALGRLPTTSTQDLVVGLCLLVVFYTITMMGITAGFHRLFTHRAYEARPAVRALMAICG